MSDKEKKDFVVKTGQEAKRVLKSGGNAGWLELSWKKHPSKEFLDAVSNEIHADCMTNVLTYENWEKLFSDAGFSQIKVMRSSMTMSAMKEMVQHESVGNVMRVMAKFLFNKRVRKRMMNLNTFFNSNSQYFGYGIYITRR